MSANVLQRLSFGVKKTPRAKQNAIPKEDDETAALRLRCLPENVREELKTLRARLAGECGKEEDHDENTKSQDNGLEVFSGKRISAEIEPPTKKRKVLASNANGSEIEKRITEKMAHLRRLNRIFTWGEDVPQPLIDFAELSLPQEIVTSLSESGIKEPSPIQMQAIPLMLQKRDVLCSAPTGSGKTLAFALPVILEVIRLKKLAKFKDNKQLLAIVLEPTRELAVQTFNQFVKFSQGLNVKTAVYDQDTVPEGVDILVSTPNRLMHHLASFDLSALRWLVVDESDRLFEVIEGQERCFRTQLAAIYKACDGKFTRRAFFSATFSYEVEEWCKANLNNVGMLCIGERNSANAHVKQELVFASSEHGKIIALRNLLQAEFDPPALVFVQSKERAKELVAAMTGFEPPIPVAFISSEKKQNERDEILKSFQEGRIWVLVCTELMGRGLDLKNVNLVVNFDLPTSIVSYIHRIGRTGRAGRSGRAITYFTEGDIKYLRPIATVIHQAGFEVPAYTLTLKKLTRNDKHDMVRHAPKRKRLAFVKKDRKFRKKSKDSKAGEGKEKTKSGKIVKKSPVPAKKETKKSVPGGAKKKKTKPVV